MKKVLIALLLFGFTAVVYGDSCPNCAMVDDPAIVVVEEPTMVCEEGVCVVQQTKIVEKRSVLVQPLKTIIKVQPVRKIIRIQPIRRVFFRRVFWY